MTLRLSRVFPQHSCRQANFKYCLLSAPTGDVHWAPLVPTKVSAPLKRLSGQEAAVASEVGIKCCGLQVPAARGKSTAEASSLGYFPTGWLWKRLKAPETTTLSAQWLWMAFQKRPTLLATCSTTSRCSLARRSGFKLKSTARKFKAPTHRFSKHKNVVSEKWEQVSSEKSHCFTGPIGKMSRCLPAKGSFAYLSAD